MFKNDIKDVTTTIDFDNDWRYICLSNISSYDNEFILFSYNDQDWTNIQLPHYNNNKSKKFTSICVSYWYRKRFNLKEILDKYHNIYLHFEFISKNNKQNKNDDLDIKIPAITIWLNENKIFSDTLSQPVNLTKYIKYDKENLLVIYSKYGYRLCLHARLLLQHHLSGQVDLDELEENIIKKGQRKSLDYMASFDDSDGLIAVFIHSLTKYIDDNNIDIEHYKNRNSHNENVNMIPIIDGPIPRLAILMLIVGTRGDVQPFIALAKALLEHGHRVRLATHEVFRKFVRENGIEFYPLAGDPASLMSFMVKNAGIVPSVSSIVAGDVVKSRRVIAEILQSTWKACIEDDDETGVSFVAEAIIANPPSYGHIHCAQKLQIPLHMIFTMPWSPTVQFPHPLCKVDYNRASIEKINRLSYLLVEIFTWSGIHSIINDFRKNILGLSTLHTRQAVRLMIDEHVPHTYCWSPSLVPKPTDWPPHIDISGFFFLDLATNYEPPEDLIQFLESGDPPIYIGFGSITGHDSERILQAVFEALQITGYRALLSGFDVNVDELPSNVFRIGNCPHDWLFQHVAAVCHHGGAGTTAAGLRAGKPTIIVPFFGDQFFWGSMISKTGAGPPPMPGKTVTAKQLATAFTFVHDPEVQSAALKISSNFQHEHGCETAVRSFHANLPLSKMRSDLESSFGACFRLNDYNLQISRPVAQVLLAAGVIEKSQLTLISTHDWPTLKHGNRIEACTRGLRRTISRLADSVHPSKRSKSASYLERTRSMSTLNMIKYDLINVEQPFKDNLQLYGEIKEQPKEEHDEDSKLAEKVKRGVHYDLPTAVKNSSVLNRSRSTLGTFSSSTMNSLRKNNSKSRPVDNIIQHSPYQNKQIRTIRNAQTNKTNRDSFLVKQQPSLQLKDQNNSKSPEQKAANMSGLSIDICKEILDDFNQIKSDRHHFNEKSKYRMGISILPILYRPRSHPTVVH